MVSQDRRHLLVTPFLSLTSWRQERHYCNKSPTDVAKIKKHSLLTLHGTRHSSTRYLITIFSTIDVRYFDAAENFLLGGGGGAWASFTVKSYSP